MTKTGEKNKGKKTEKKQTNKRVKTEFEPAKPSLAREHHIPVVGEKYKRSDPVSV